MLVAVGTPSTDGKIDLKYFGKACEQIGGWLRNARRFVSVVVKSTVIPGTTDVFVRNIVERAAGKKLGQFGLGMNPEFLREGSAVEDFMKADRIVLGYEDTRTLTLLREAYRNWSCEKLEVNTRTAEMIKYANNCLLATQISAVNELANLCFEVGNVDVEQVMAGVHLDKRWNPIGPGGKRTNPQILTYLVPGCGFGGSCFPKDLQALRTMGREHGLLMPILQSVLDINDQQPLQVLRLLKSQFSDLSGKRILVLGIAFKPETDDVRESASLRIIRELAAAGCQVVAHDPLAGANAAKELADVEFTLAADWKAEIARTDAVVIATKWPEYLGLKRAATLRSSKNQVIVDPRRLFRPNDFKKAIYLTIGRRMS